MLEVRLSLLVIFCASSPNGSFVDEVAFGGLNANRSFDELDGVLVAGVADVNDEPGGGASVNEPVLNAALSGGAGAGALVKLKSPKPLLLLLFLLLFVLVSPNPPKASKSFRGGVGLLSNPEKESNPFEAPLNASNEV